jgi:hypothetical protein
LIGVVTCFATCVKLIVFFLSCFYFFGCVESARCFIIADKKCRPNAGWGSNKMCKYNSKRGNVDCSSGDQLVCFKISGRCKSKLNDYVQCDASLECKSGRCNLWWGATKKCTPTNGWRDYEPCTNGGHCASSKCYKMTTYGADTKCRPANGWAVGDGCKHNSGRHDCTTNAYCRASDGICKNKLSDMSVCARSGDCLSNSCTQWWGTTYKCKPNAGWADRSPCTASSHCASKSCVNTFGTDKKCKPSAGWNEGEACTSSSHCSAGSVGYKLIKTNTECNDNGEEHLGSSMSLSKCAESCARKSGCTVFILANTGGTCYYEKTKNPHQCSNPITTHYNMYDLTGDLTGDSLICGLGKCKSKLNDLAVCTSNGECKSNSCAWWYGGVHKCKPTNGWADRSPCKYDSHCKSNSCVVTAGTDKKCKPSGGWNKNERCSSSSHCAGTRKCDGWSCQDIKLYNKVRHCENCYSSCQVGLVWCSNCYVCGGRHDCGCKTGGCPVVLGRVLSDYDSRRCWDWDK